MVKRQQKLVSWKVYVFTFIISVIIFALGILIGVTLENERQKNVQIDLLQYQSDLENMWLQHALIDQGGLRCELYPEMFKQLYTALDNMGEKLENYQGQGKFFEFEFKKLKQQYTTLSIRTWMLLEKVRVQCPSDFSTLLYFYSSKDCKDCLSQGVVLDSLKKKYGMELMIFPIDADYTHPAVHSLNTYYNVTQVPTTIVNAETVYPGLTKREPIENKICEQIGC